MVLEVWNMLTENDLRLAVVQDRAELPGEYHMALTASIYFGVGLGCARSESVVNT